jgi:glucokinase
VIPIIFSDRVQQSTKGQAVLAADVGGTKVNLALYMFADGKPQATQARQYHSASFTSFSAILHKFFGETGIKKPGSICAGVAGAIVNDAAELVNLPWGISKKEIAEATGVEDVMLINDLEANAYGLALLQDKDMITLHKGAQVPGNAAIVAPGTGLGEAGLYWDGNFYRPFATEGGHCDFAPRTSLDAELHIYLKKIHEIVSWEHVVSGPGIHAVYNFLRDVKKMEEPEWLKEEMHAEDASAAISEAALQNRCGICVETMKLFVEHLARICTILALKLKATGGIFLGGGIPPKIVKLLQQDTFAQTFLTCDRQQSLMEIIPIQVIMNDKTALLGAAYYGGFSRL